MTQKAVTHTGLDVSGEQMFQWAAKNFVGGRAVGGFFFFFFPTETSSAVCRRAGNSARVAGARVVSTGSGFHFMLPPRANSRWFFGTTEAAGFRCAGLTAPAAGRSNRERSRTPMRPMRQTGSRLLLQAGLASWPRRGSGTAPAPGLLRVYGSLSVANARAGWDLEPCN